MRWTLPLLLVVGCTTNDTLTGPHDLYRLTGELIPQSSAATHTYGVDIDGSGKSNLLGSLLTLMVSEQLGDPQAGTDGTFSTQPPALVIDVQHSTQNDVVGVNAFAGDVAGYDPSSPPQAPLVGSSPYPTITAMGGDLPMVIAPFGVAVPFVLHDAHATLTAGPDFIAGGIGGWIDPDIVTDQLVPQWQPTLQAIIARDCTRPRCGCQDGTPGSTAEGFFDINHDCTLTADEINQSEALDNVLHAYVNADGKPTVTFGFGVEAAFVRTAD